MPNLTALLMGLWFVPPMALVPPSTRTGESMRGAPSVYVRGMELAQHYGGGAPQLAANTAAFGIRPNDWSGSFRAWYACESAANSTEPADDGSICGGAGSACDLTDVNTVGRDTTNFVQGTQACNFIRGNQEELNCTDASCGTDLDGGGFSMTWGAWIRPTSTGINTTMVHNGTYCTGRYITYGNTSNQACAQICATQVDACGGSGTLASNTWVHHVGRFNTGSSLQLLLDGAQVTSTATTQDIDGDTAPFAISVNAASFDLGAQVDEVFVYRGALTDAQVCRMCSCGIDSATNRCMCSASTPTEYLACANDSDCQLAGHATARCGSDGRCTGLNTKSNPGCGSCTLPACNASAP